MHADSLRLARYLCSRRVDNAYDILQLSRVCETPTAVGYLLAVGRHFLASDKKTWVHECLLELPDQ